MGYMMSSGNSPNRTAGTAMYNTTKLPPKPQYQPLSQHAQ